ncbi:MAG: TrmH family RNA methyltransferase [Acidobacteriota bacterium]
MRPSAPAILLVDPEGPRNVGAVCRAMRNFGAGDLRVVGADVDSLLAHDEAIATAMSGKRVLRAARTFPDLAAAREGIDALVGATARPGRRRAPILAPWDLASTILAGKRRIGIVLGNEVRGLDRAQLRQCEFLVRIPALQGADSLNLAQAALVLLWEWRRAELSLEDDGASEPRRIEDLLQHFERTLAARGFLAAGDPLRAMPKLRRFLLRAGPTPREIGLLHAILQHWERQRP